MAIQQISVFVSNLAGGVADIVETIGKEGINIRALSIADTSDFGILRLIVDDLGATKKALKEMNYVYSVNEVLAVSISDSPGGLSGILRLLADASINLEYIYAFVSRKEANAFAVLRLADQAQGEAVLSSHQVKLVSPEELAEL